MVTDRVSAATATDTTAPKATETPAALVYREGTPRMKEKAAQNQI